MYIETFTNFDKIRFRVLSSQNPAPIRRRRKNNVWKIVLVTKRLDKINVCVFCGTYFAWQKYLFIVEKRARCTVTSKNKAQKWWYTKLAHDKRPTARQQKNVYFVCGTNLTRAAQSQIVWLWTIMVDDDLSKSQNGRIEVKRDLGCMQTIRGCGVLVYGKSWGREVNSVARDLAKKDTVQKKGKVPYTCW